MRVRGFTQDDAHIFCLPEQLTDEIVGVRKGRSTTLVVVVGVVVGVGVGLNRPAASLATPPLTSHSPPSPSTQVLDLTETILSRFGFSDYQVT